MIINITSSNFESDIVQSPLPVVIDAYAIWCGPCKQMAPLFDELAKEFAGVYTFAKINVDEERDLAIKLSISSIPTFIFFKGGKIVGRESGYLNKAMLKSKVESMLG